MADSPTKRIEVLGPGCARCKETYRVVTHLVTTEQLPFTVEKVESMDRMVELGVLATPAVAVDGKVVFSGRIPKAEDLRPLLYE
ncbi:thioredoxin family protein [Acidobacteria bacterium ACD]|nr:MAG: thioredoxin family protein [Acidobacteriota bacterium]MCE7957860.1 thioredoxin family protein [Acidobacteria bacterium ACB2]MDL1952048.1 thioredoxin family protein [Acidobacteria bacterium ACD]